MGALFKKVLVANRSEIAVRVMNACRTLNIPTVAVYSDADVTAKHRKYADESVHIGEAAPGSSYLAIDKLIDAAKQTGADAIHPGYGFLAENPNLPRRCEEAGIAFIGPPPDAMTLMGNKVEARIKMADAGVPLIPGMSSGSEDLAVFEEAAIEAGFPVMIKAAAGGGGKGMRIVHEPSALQEAIEGAQREAKGAFGDSTVYLEKYIANPRHIEFQIIADSHGNCVHVFERECSIQRRHQKIIEETPSVALSNDVRERMGHDAIKVAQACGYVNAGTVEFLFDESGNYYFLEMNTRIQVEHPITEMVTGTDLVVEQIRVGAGKPLSDHLYNLNQRGHAIECRIYAEDGENNFMPSSGKIVYYREPVGPGIRVDSGVEQGTDVTIDYDPILAKLIVHAPTRDLAIQKMIRALNDYKLLGVRTSKRFMIDCMAHPEFIAGRTFTNFIERHMSERSADPSEVRDIAAAAASVASVKAHAASIAAAADGDGREPPTPWDIVGSWEIGDKIHEQA